MSNLHDLMREIHGVKTQGMDLVKPLNNQAALSNLFINISCLRELGLALVRLSESSESLSRLLFNMQGPLIGLLSKLPSYI